VYCAGFITNTHFLTQQKYHEKIIRGFFVEGGAYISNAEIFSTQIVIFAL